MAVWVKSRGEQQLHSLTNTREAIVCGHSRAVATGVAAGACPDSAQTRANTAVYSFFLYSALCHWACIPVQSDRCAAPSERWGFPVECISTIAYTTRPVGEFLLHPALVLVLLLQTFEEFAPPLPPPCVDRTILTNSSHASPCLFTHAWSTTQLDVCAYR